MAKWSMCKNSVDRTVKHPATFYVASTPTTASVSMLPMNFQNSTWRENVYVNESAMLSCWKKVHGGAHDLETRTRETVVNSKGVDWSVSLADKKSTAIHRSKSLMDGEIVGRNVFVARRPASMSILNNQDNLKLSRPVRYSAFNGCITAKENTGNNSVFNIHSAPNSSQQFSDLLLPYTQNYKTVNKAWPKSANEVPEEKDNGNLVKTKMLAMRQSSYPGLRERTLIQNEAKRLSMPLPVLCKKEMIQRHYHEQATVKVEAITDTVSIFVLVTFRAGTIYQ